MSRVDLDRNRSQLQQAYNDVSNLKTDTDWILLGYEGQSNVLKLVAKGDGGIEEMVDDLSSGQIMYAFCRVLDPNTNLPKFVLINWQGEGVQEMRKGSCSNHFRDVSNILRGAHVTVHARTEDDVDVDDILKKVAKSSGANYSFHKEKPNPEMNAPAGPVLKISFPLQNNHVSRYQIRANQAPQLEIKPDLRDKFWKKQQEDEKDRQEELQKKNRDAKEKMEIERREREQREAQQREAKEQERIKKIYETKKAEREAENAKDAEMKKKWEETQVEALRDDEERRKRAEKLKKERAQEAKSLVQQRSANPRDAFERKTSQFDQQPAKEPPPPPRKLKSGFLDEPKSQFDEPQKPVRSPPAKQPSPPAAAPAAVPAAPAILAGGLPKRQDSDEEEEAEEQDWNGNQEDNLVLFLSDGGMVKDKYLLVPKIKIMAEMAEPAAGQQPPQDLYDDVNAPAAGNEELYDDVKESVAANEDLYADVQEPAAGNLDPYADGGEPAAGGEEHYDDVKGVGGDIYDDVKAPAAGSPEPVASESLYADVGVSHQEDKSQFPPEKGLVARALFDYQACEENEITFDPGDMITNIEQIDPGWWVGTAPDGTQGMFPSNYVEILNG
ncbi:hypothetical protein LSH36_75g01036 [Paralvinella palmiformis]|uniref:Coactosin-like protein n=1 Tax=Paralvinella palmiformis TaxID=53620 RepID=A0AAD9K2P6_9ANNE|nr:hypothetical protein LSH36_75g01036 [Paralvinella palmiformis]